MDDIQTTEVKFMGKNINIGGQKSFKGKRTMDLGLDIIGKEMCRS